MDEMCVNINSENTKYTYENLDQVAAFLPNYRDLTFISVLYT